MPTSSATTSREYSSPFPLFGLVLGTAFGLAAGIALAFAYSYATALVPIVGYITFALSVAFGLAMAYAIAYGFRLGKVRSATLSAAVGLLVGTVSFYVSWAVWVYAMIRRGDLLDVSLMDLMTHPVALFDIIQGINQSGRWTMGSFTPKGAVLWALWALEALLIVGPAALAGVLLDDRDR